MVSRITQQITFLDTNDLQKTADFYKNVLGLEQVLDQGACRIFRICGDAYLGFCEGPVQPEHAEQVVLTLVTDDVDGWASHLREKGVFPDTPPQLNEKYKIYHFYVSDPNGFKLEIQKFLHPFGVQAS